MEEIATVFCFYKVFVSSIEAVGTVMESRYRKLDFFFLGLFTEDHRMVHVVVLNGLVTVDCLECAYSSFSTSLCSRELQKI